MKSQSVPVINRLQDQHGHSITYLRISVTDRCNLRCIYCMPPGGIVKKQHTDIMRYEEIHEVVRCMARYGLRAVRLTGGEPLVRPQLPLLVEMIASIPGIEDISLTTNGILLEKYAQALASAGLKRVNISLDTLQAEKFQRISSNGTLQAVWRGIEAAEKYSLLPIKINTVALRGINDDEFVDLAMLTLHKPWHVRFIELMPIGNQYPWGDGFPSAKEAFIPVGEIQARLAEFGLEPVEKQVGSGPARTFRLAGAMGTIGFISPLSEHFCGNCNRLRLTADGHLRPCLLNDVEVALLPRLRAGKSILPLLKKTLRLKPASHELDADQLPEERTMKEIGG